VVPDHSTFSKNRHGRFRESNPFRQLFAGVLSHRIAEGLVGGSSFGADASRYTKVERASWSVPDTVTRAKQDHPDTLDDAAFCAATPVEPKALSPIDPANRYTGANGDRPSFAYSTNYLVDFDNAVIADVETTAPLRQAATGIVQDMVVQTKEHFGLHPDLTSKSGKKTSLNPGAFQTRDRSIEDSVQAHLPECTRNSDIALADSPIFSHQCA
jgi:hypothetical protein